MNTEHYEISLWEDVPILANGSPAEVIDTNIHYEERKILTIGSDSMTNFGRAFSPVLTENINGTNTFTFKMYYLLENKEKNPYIDLLFNERKVKVLWHQQWYDFIIKNSQEDSLHKCITYICKDQFIQELSKNGYALTFDDALNNNQGTVTELGTRVVEGTDWTINPNSDIIQENIEEALYGGVTSTAFEAQDQYGYTHTILPNKNIYIYYSVVTSQNSFFQFIYNENGEYEQDANRQLITNANCFMVEGVTWEKSDTAPFYKVTLNNKTIVTINSTNVSEQYRGERLVREQKKYYDKNLKRYVEVYNKPTSDINGDAGIYYGYKTVDFVDPITIVNLIFNHNHFSNSKGWTDNQGALRWEMHPTLEEARVNTETTVDEALYNSISYLRLSNQTINTGIQSNVTYLAQGFTQNEQYKLRLKGHLSKPNGDFALTAFDAETVNTDIEIIATINHEPVSLFSTIQKSDSNNGWVEYTLQCNKSLTKKEIIDYNVCIHFINHNTNYIWLEDIELYKQHYGEKDIDGTLTIVELCPGDVDSHSVAVEYLKYYSADSIIHIDNAEDYRYAYVSQTTFLNGQLVPPVPWDSIQPVYNSDFAKIRTLHSKQSNRFNLIQKLAELFGCFADFTIAHTDDGTGRLKYVYDGNEQRFKPVKMITFKREVGVDNGLGFTYGRDLRSITRTINSDQIATKIIVAPNKNEFAKDGSCNIAFSEHCLTKEDFVLNFDYYIQMGLLSKARVYNDLYAKRGYYDTLRTINSQRDMIGEIVNIYTYEKATKEKMKQLIQNEITNNITERNSIRSRLAILAGVPEFLGQEDRILEAMQKNNNNDMQEQWSMLCKCENDIAEFNNRLAGATADIQILTNIIESKQATLAELKAQISIAHQNFNNTYAQYLLEGTWTSEEYTDDNLYYLDAESVAYTSARPQISYNISVCRLSSLPEYKMKIFHKGDIGFIQDTDFFGYVYINNNKTPYKEKVIITEITYNFDTPSKDEIKVQNYKNKFEDLFQRITASTQALQLDKGNYQRAARAVDDKGTINTETLNESFRDNNNLEWKALNDTMKIGSDGIKLINANNPLMMSKVASAGFYVSEDGGLSWKSALVGRGVELDTLTSGTIDTKNITLSNGDTPSFKWDSRGITCFAISGSSTEVASNSDRFSNLSVYVPDNLGQEIPLVLEEATSYRNIIRFDRFGIYGIRHTPRTNFVPASEDEIWNLGNVGITWRGFFLRNEDSSVQIDSKKDIVVLDKNNISRVHIGRIGTEASGPLQEVTYGIKMRNSANEPIFWTDNQGNLTITGVITALGGDIGGFKIFNNRLSTDNDNIILSGNYNNNDIVFKATSNFIVKKDGSLNCSDASIIGEFSAGENFKVDRAGKMTCSDATITNGHGNNSTIRLSTKDASLTFGEENAKIGTVPLKMGLRTIEVPEAATIGAIMCDSLTTPSTHAGRLADENSLLLDSAGSWKYDQLYLGNDGFSITKWLDEKDDAGNTIMSRNASTIVANFSGFAVYADNSITRHVKGIGIQADSITFRHFKGEGLLSTIGALTIGDDKMKVSGQWVQQAQANMEYNTAPSTRSDKNYKNSIEPLDSRYLKLFDSLQPKRFKFNDGQSTRYHTGFIAQDLELAIETAGLTSLDVAAFCRTTTTNKETNELQDLLTIRYEELIAIAVAKIKALEQRIIKLEGVKGGTDNV